MHVYTDGSVQVNHGGTEMGQGLHTKIAQIVADELGLPFERVLLHASRHRQGAQHSATAATSGTDLNGSAAQFAARNVRDNLAAFVGRAGRLRRRRGQLRRRPGDLAQGHRAASTTS